LASFSNFGPNTVALAAPGVNINSTELPFGAGQIGSFTGYCLLSGTSMAAPHVAGVVALAYSYSPHDTLQDVKAALLNGADHVPAPSGLVSAGRLDALETLQLLKLKVVASTPADGDVLTTKPTDFTLDFSDAFDPASVSASAFTVDGTAANSFTVNDPFTL